MDRLPIYLIVLRQRCTPYVWNTPADGALLLFSSQDAAETLAHVLNGLSHRSAAHVVVEITSYQQLASWVQTIMPRCNEVWWDAVGADTLLAARVEGLAEFVSTLWQAADREAADAAAESAANRDETAPPRC